MQSQGCYWRAKKHTTHFYCQSNLFFLKIITILWYVIHYTWKCNKKVNKCPGWSHSALIMLSRLFKGSRELFLTGSTGFFGRLSITSLNQENLLSFGYALSPPRIVRLYSSISSRPTDTKKYFMHFINHCNWRFRCRPTMNISLCFLCHFGHHI